MLFDTKMSQNNTVFILKDYCASPNLFIIFTFFLKPSLKPIK